MRQTPNEHISQLLDLTAEGFIHESDTTFFCFSSSFLGHFLQVPLSLLIDTNWNILGLCHQTVVLWLLAVCFHGYRIHFLELNITPAMAVTTKVMFLPQKVTEVQLHVSSFIWMARSHLEFNMAEFNYLPSFPMPQLQTFSVSRVTHFKNTSLVHTHQKHPISLFLYISPLINCCPFYVRNTF